MSATAANLSFDTVVLTGGIAPGTSGATFLLPGLNAPSVNAAGEVAFRASFTGGDATAATNVGIFTPSTLVARLGDLAPGTDGASFLGLADLPSLNAAGEVAFRALLTGGANNAGIFTSSGLVARTGDPAPGTDGASFVFFVDPSLNAAGEVAFLASIAGGDTDADNNAGIFTSSGLVARLGDPAPGTGGASFVEFAELPSLNAGGEVAFYAALAGGDATSENFVGIFTSSALVARRGDDAPGTGGASFASFDNPILNDSGETAFRASLQGDGIDPDVNAEGIFTSSGLVARAGDAVPDAGDGTRFRVFRDFSLNALGEVAFLADLNGGDSDFGSANRGLFLADAFGILHTVLRVGDEFKVGDDDFRTIADFVFGREGLSDDALAFRLSFIDGTGGIFTATIDRGQVGVIPLPASGLLLLLGLGSLGVVARRRRAAA